MNDSFFFVNCRTTYLKYICIYYEVKGSFLYQDPFHIFRPKNFLQEKIVIGKILINISG